MELIDAILGRRTVRRYLGKEIPDKEIRKIIEAGNWAPSACNIQGWRFIVIKDKTNKLKIVNSGGASFIKDAPIGILVVYDNRTENTEYSDHIQSASACIQNMLLTAWSLNIGCSWICHLPPKSRLRKIFKIPKSYDPIAYIAMGYFQKTPTPSKRISETDGIISFEKFDFNVKGKSSLELCIKRIGRKIYYMIPFRKLIKPYVDSIFEKKFDENDK